MRNNDDVVVVEHFFFNRKYDKVFQTALGTLDIRKGLASLVFLSSLAPLNWVWNRPSFARPLSFLYTDALMTKVFSYSSAQKVIMIELICPPEETILIKQGEERQWHTNNFKA